MQSSPHHRPGTRTGIPNAPCRPITRVSFARSGVGLSPTTSRTSRTSRALKPTSRASSQPSQPHQKPANRPKIRCPMLNKCSCVGLWAGKFLTRQGGTRPTHVRKPVFAGLGTPVGCVLGTFEKSLMREGKNYLTQQQKNQISRTRARPNHPTHNPPHFLTHSTPRSTGFLTSATLVPPLQVRNFSAHHPTHKHHHQPPHNPQESS